MFIELFQQTYTLIVGSLGMLGALAWNDAITNWFSNNPYLNKYGPWVYAIFVTIISVMVVYILNKFIKSRLFFKKIII